MMPSTLLYSDTLIEMTEESILFRNYFFPFGDKRVSFKDIDTVMAVKPTLRSGKYRYYGTGDFHTWFPPDVRSSRDRIFIMQLKNKWWRIGFTVQNSQTVLDLLKNRCPVKDQSIKE